MIRLIEGSGKSARILFSPRVGFRRGASKVNELERTLVYGHVCPVCRNVIQALFLTDTQVNLWPYEETIEISEGKETMGEVLHYWPKPDSHHGYSQYTSMRLHTTQGDAQKIVLKNHVLKYHGIDANKNGGYTHFVSGGHMCSLTGIASHRPDLLICDLMHFYRLPDVDKNAWKNSLPPLDDFIAAGEAYGMRTIPTIGEGPRVVLFPKIRVTDQVSWAWQMRNILNTAKYRASQKSILEDTTAKVSASALST